MRVLEKSPSVHTGSSRPIFAPKLNDFGPLIIHSLHNSQLWIFLLINGRESKWQKGFRMESAGAISAVDCLGMLDVSYPEETLFEQARAVANRKKGFITASPIILTGNCTTRPICNHCKWEHFKVISENEFALDRSLEALKERAHVLRGLGIKRAFCATGWMGYRLPTRFIEAVEVIRDAEPDLELFGLFGALDRQSHRDLAHAGLTGMLTGLESPSESVYRSFRPGGDSLDDRIRALSYALEEDLVVWTGFLVGLGESAKDVVRGIRIIGEFNPESVSILPFVPFPDTPMSGNPPTDPAWLARVNAVTRIALPDVHYFFSDHDGGFSEEVERRLGMNASYETGAGRP